MEDPKNKTQPASVNTAFGSSCCRQEPFQCNSKQTSRLKREVPLSQLRLFCFNTRANFPFLSVSLAQSSLPSTTRCLPAAWEQERCQNIHLGTCWIDHFSLPLPHGQQVVSFTSVGTLKVPCVLRLEIYVLLLFSSWVHPSLNYIVWEVMLWFKERTVLLKGGGRFWRNVQFAYCIAWAVLVWQFA